MTIARIDNGQVAEYRNDITINDVPPHKQNQWLPVVDTKPAFDALTQYLTGPVVVVNAGVDVTRTWTVNNRTITPEMVEAEADRRVAVRLGSDDTTKALVINMRKAMRVIRTLNKKVDGQTPTAGETTEAVDFVTTTSDIDAIRAGEAALKLMDPIPLDYATNETYWQ